MLFIIMVNGFVFLMIVCCWCLVFVLLWGELTVGADMGCSGIVLKDVNSKSPLTIQHLESNAHTNRIVVAGILLFQEVVY